MNDMETHKKSAGGTAHPATADRYDTHTHYTLKLPPFAKTLIARQQYRNHPFLAVVCAGVEAWEHAQQWNRQPDYSAVVLPAGQRPDSFKWPVKGLDCIIERSAGPDDSLIIDLVKALFLSGALTVSVRPNNVDYQRCLDEFNLATGEWIEKDRLRVYRNPLVNGGSDAS